MIAHYQRATSIQVPLRQPTRRTTTTTTTTTISTLDAAINNNNTIKADRQRKEQVPQAAAVAVEAGELTS